MQTGFSTRTRPGLLLLQGFFFFAGLMALGYWGYATLESHAVQAYENWAFEQELASKQPTIGGYLQSLIGREPELAPLPQSPAQDSASIRPWSGRVEIPRLKMSAMVLHGVDNKTLRRAVGHIPGTAAPGASGNVGLAAHRDTFFRGLRNVRRDDLIRVEGHDGAFYYRVDSIRIVTPDRVDVLQADSEPTLTLVTCYPFDFVGKAPERFIVRAKQIPSKERTQGS